MGINVQVCWEKFANYWDVEMRLVPMEGDRYHLSAEEAVARCDENTIGVVAILGSTFDGSYEPIKEICDALDDLQARTGLDVPVHADGASGAFVAPFVDPELEWDFRLPRVSSINASGHKYGLVPPGLGWVVFRERKVFNENLVFYVNYLGGEMPTATLNFSRNAFQIAVQYYLFLRLGRPGYTRIMRHAVENAVHLRKRLVDSGYFRIMNETQRIPVVALTLAPEVTRFNEFDVSNKVRERGWVLSAYSMPPDAQDVRSLRVVVRPHLNRNVIDLLADDIVKACDYLAAHGGSAKAPQLHDASKTTETKC
jgi:glutamate decarboxylase